MKTKHIVIICFIAGLLSWWSLESATVAGWMKTERNAAHCCGGTVPPGREAEIRRKLLAETLGDPWGIALVLVAFQAPTLASIVFRRYSFVKYLVLVAVIILLVNDLAVAVDPDGGDFKGCSKCDAPYLIHVGFGFLSLISSALALAVFAVLNVWKRLQNRFSRELV